MKKVILSTLTAASFIAASDSHARNFTGFSVGVNAGATFSKTKYGYDDDTVTPAYGSSEGFGHGSHGNGLAGLVFGYGHLFSNCFFLGAEAFIDGNFGKDHTLVSNQNLSIRSKIAGTSYGVLTRFGGTISSDTLLYVGVGGKSSKHEYTIISHNMGLGGPDFTQSKRSFRLLAEAGLQGYLASRKNVTWRVAYQYVPGTAVKETRFPAGHALVNPGDNSFSSIKTSDHTLRIGVAYHF